MKAIGACRGVYDECPMERCKCREETQLLDDPIEDWIEELCEELMTEFERFGRPLRGCAEISGKIRVAYKRGFENGRAKA